MDELSRPGKGEGCLMVSEGGEDDRGRMTKGGRESSEGGGNRVTEGEKGRGIRGRRNVGIIKNQLRHLGQDGEQGQTLPKGFH